MGCPCIFGRKANFTKLPGSVSWGSRDHILSIMKAQKKMKALKRKPSAQDVCMMMCLRGHAQNNGYLHCHTLHMPGVYIKLLSQRRRLEKLPELACYLYGRRIESFLLFALSAASVVGKTYCNSARCCHGKQILICSKWLVHTNTFEGKAFFQKSTTQKREKLMPMLYVALS